MSSAQFWLELLVAVVVWQTFALILIYGTGNDTGWDWLDKWFYPGDFR